MFLGIDDTMNIGIRGPSNLFGHPTDEQIDALESELRYWDKIQPNSSITKVVFGHFPLSFVASSEKGMRYETILARQSVSAYICGHLHAKFSKQLWKRHAVEVTFDDSKMPSRVKKQFWEWELGDWKEFKLIRILAVDEGEVSFVDMDLSSKPDYFQTTILITYPTDSRSMNRITAVPENQVVRNDINALIFSAQPILNVTAKVFDSSRAFKIVEELPMLPAAAGSAICSESFYHAKWNAENYRNDPSAARYWLQVFVIDSEGDQIVSARRPFSAERKPAKEYPRTWLAFLVFGFRWEGFYSILLWTNIVFLSVLLFLPKLLNQFMDRSSSYQKWAASVSISSTVQQRRALFTVLWFLIEGSRSRALWSSMSVYLLYLLRFPWFWGHVTSVNGDVAPMYMFGWRIKSPVTVDAADEQWLGNPDVMTITLPFMYFVVTPLLLLIYFLSAERSAACFQSSTRKSVKPDQNSQVIAESLCKSSETRNRFPPLRPRTRKRAYLFLSCLVLICIHFKQCSALMAAYGVTTVALSPAFSWIPPLLLATTIYTTSDA